MMDLYHKSVWLLGVLFVNLFRDSIIPPDSFLIVEPKWVLYGTLLLKINVPEIPGQEVRLKAECGRLSGVYIFRQRPCYPLTRVNTGKDTYVSITGNGEMISFFFFIFKTAQFHELQPHPLSYEIITDKNEVDRIIQLIFDQANFD